MSEIEDNAENKPDGSPVPSSDQSVLEDVDEGEPFADPSAPKLSGPPTPSVPVSSSETSVKSDEPAHEAEVNEQEQPQDSLPTAEVGSSRDSLGDFDWDDLEQRFCAAMEKFQKMEDEIREEYRQWLEVCFSQLSSSAIYSGLIGIRSLGGCDIDSRTRSRS